MYFSKAELRSDALRAGQLAALGLGNGYGFHQALWKLFSGGQKKKRDFIYRKRESGRRPCFLIASASEPHDEQGIWDLQVKPYRPVLKEGDRLAFDLRANPVVARRSEGVTRSKRHDVVMDEKLRLRMEEGKNPDEIIIQEVIYRSGSAWLTEKADKCGFRVEGPTLRIEGYRQIAFRKPQQKREIRFSTLDFTGILTVLDETRFVDALYTGIGPAKAFGCGLLLVRKAC